MSKKSALKLLKERIKRIETINNQAKSEAEKTGYGRDSLMFMAIKSHEEQVSFLKQVTEEVKGMRK